MYKITHAILAALLLLNSALKVNANPLEIDSLLIPTSIQSDLDKLSNIDFTYHLETVISNG